LVKESTRDGREGRERRKKIMERGIEYMSLLGCDAVRWVSTTNVLNGCIAVASPRVVLWLRDPEENALQSCKSPAQWHTITMHYGPATYLPSGTPLQCTMVVQVTCPVTHHHNALCPASHLPSDTPSHSRRWIFRSTIVSALILQNGLRGPPRADVVTAYPCKGLCTPGG
jgi:hypothetical protein